MADKTIQLQYASPANKRKSRAVTGGSAIVELLSFSFDILLWSFAAIFLIGILAGILMGLVGGPVAGFPNILAGVVMIPTLAAAAVGIRRRRAMAVLGYLQQAVRLNLPLNRVLGAAARSEKGKTAQRLSLLREDLEAGFSLGNALADAVPEMSLRTLGLIDYASNTGSLPQTLNRLVAEEVNRSRNQRNDQPFSAWYPALLIVIVCGCISLLDIFVAPKFIQIFRDFRVPLPAVFQWTDWLADFFWVIGPVVLLILFFCLGYQMRKVVRMREGVLALRGLQDGIAWRLPAAASLHSRSQYERHLRFAGRFVLSRLSAGSFSGSFGAAEFKHGPAKATVELVRTGCIPACPLPKRRVGQKMPGLLVGMMTTARDTAGLSEVFTFVGRFHTDRFLLRREAMRAAVIPLFTLMMGVIVAMVALSILVPMQQLVAKLSW